jgi:hypothetical protein
MPGTLVKSPGCSNGPCSSRYATILVARTFPTPGKSDCNSVALASLTSTSSSDRARFCALAAMLVHWMERTGCAVLKTAGARATPASAPENYTRKRPLRISQARR